MGQTNFSGPVQSAGGYKVGDTEVINSSGEYVGGIDVPPGSVGAEEVTTPVKVVSSTITIQPPPAPTGSDQLNVDRRFFRFPPAVAFENYTSASLVAVGLFSDTATSGSDATNQYTFEIFNSTAGESLTSTPKTTSSQEIAAYEEYAIDVDQNNTDLSPEDNMEIRIDILDDGGAGPTDLSGATINVVFYWYIND